MKNVVPWIAAVWVVSAGCQTTGPVVSATHQVAVAARAGRSVNVTINKDATASPDPVIIFDEDDDIVFTKGEGVDKFKVKITHQKGDNGNDNDAPKLKGCDENDADCKLEKGETKDKGNNCKAGNDKLLFCTYKYSIKVWLTAGGQIEKDPIIIISQGP